MRCMTVDPRETLRNRRAAKPKLGDGFKAPSQPDTPQVPQPPNDAADTPHPDETPEPTDTRPEVGNKIDKLIKEAIEYAHRHMNTRSGESMLDETIFAMRKRGLSISEIARHFQGSITEQEVEHRIARNLANFSALSTSEYRALQVARLEDVLNMCYDYARGGSEEHVKMFLLGIERLNKMFELETQKTQVEISLVTTHQASLILSIVDAVIRIIVDRLTSTAPSPSTESTESTAINVPEDVLQEITADALDAATEQLVQAQRSTLEIDLNQETGRVVVDA